MQTKSPLFDGVAKVIAEAAGTAEGVRREAETVINSQLQRFLADMDLVPREEFEILEDRVKALEAEIAALRADTGAKAD